MAASLESLQRGCAAFEASMDEFVASTSSWTTVEQAMANNRELRKRYAEVEIMRLDLEELLLKNSSENNSANNGDAQAATELANRLESLSKRLKLRSVRRIRWDIPTILSIVIRFAAVLITFIPVGTLGSLLILVLREIDRIVPGHDLADTLRRFISHMFLMVAGVHIRVEGLDRGGFPRGKCALLTFTHASNLDGFIIAATCPVRHFAFGKKELFCVPFFSWISFAFGGVPVDRQNRDRAIRTLQRCADSATLVSHGSNAKSECQGEQCCLVISPEGTRSLSGQLLSFKKGPFHIYEQLQSPIVPMIIIGAYDIYPVGNWVNNTGTVVARFLPPILPSEARNRDEMMRLLRRRMLMATLDTPCDIGRELTRSENLTSHFCAIFALFVDFLMIRGFHRLCFDILGLTSRQFWTCTTLGSIVLTAWLYYYSVYVVDKQYSHSAAKKME